jgi:hemolysin activation/secretion protein
MAGLAAALAAAHGASATAPQTLSPPPRTFDVEAYDIDGNKLLEEIEVERAVYPFLGPGRTGADIDHARDALEKAYHDKGYQSVVVEIPAQSVSDNIVRLHVIEAPVGRLRVTGSRYHSLDVIRKEASAFQEGQVPNINEAQKELDELNRRPDRRVSPVLTAGTVPGTVDVNLKVDDNLPLHASLEFTNDHSPDTDPLRLTATTHYDNLWQAGHSVSFTYSVAPQDVSQSEIFAGSYLAPFANTPWSLLVYGYDSNSNVASLGGTTVLGKGYAIGTRGVLQLPAKGDLAQSVSFGLDFKNFIQDVTFGGATTPVPIEYWPINAVYTLQRDGRGSSTKATLGFTAGLPLGSNTATFDHARANAKPTFVHLNLDVTQTESLGGGVEAALRVSAQVANEPLVSNEQFAIGGLASVRGYLQSEEVGDDGFTGSLEVRSPIIAPKFAPFLDSLRFYIFSDGGTVTILDPAPGVEQYFALASAGVGMRFGFFKHLTGDVLVANPFITGMATHANQPRATFSLKTDF